MDSPASNASNKRSPSVDPIQPDELAIVPVPVPDTPDHQPQDQEMEQEPEQQDQMAIPEEDREYGCKFCEKKFSNKQALGGHQNAHKVERTTTTSRDMHESPLALGARGYFGASSSNNPLPPPPPPPPVPSAAAAYGGRNHDLLSRAFIPWPTYQPQPQNLHLQQQHFYGTRHAMQLPDPYAPPRSLSPLYNNNNLYLQGSWINQAPAAPPPRMPIIITNPNYLNQGGGYIGFAPAPAPRPNYEFQPGAGFPGPLRLGPAPDRNRTAEGPNLRNVAGADIDEAGIDLRLRL